MLQGSQWGRDDRDRHNSIKPATRNMDCVTGRSGKWYRNGLDGQRTFVAYNNVDIMNAEQEYLDCMIQNTNRFCTITKTARYGLGSHSGKAD